MTERTHFCVRHFRDFHTLDGRLRVSFIKVIDCKNVTSLFVSQKTTVEATSTYLLSNTVIPRLVQVFVEILFVHPIYLIVYLEMNTWNFGYLDIWFLINNCHFHSFTYACRTFEGW